MKNRIEFDYTNYRNISSRRKVNVLGIRWGVSKYYSTPQWLVNCFDLEKEEKREFSLKEMKNIQEIELDKDETASNCNLGATGKHPDFPLDEFDGGELVMGVKYDSIYGLVLLNFGEPISIIGMTPDQALSFAEILIKAAKEKI